MKLSKFLTVIVLVIFGALLANTDNFPQSHSIDYVEWVESIRILMIIGLYIFVGDDILSEEQRTELSARRFLFIMGFLFLSIYIMLTTSYLWPTILVLIGFIFINAIIVKKKK